ncbi:MAG TPA: SUKH-4 family immunity protein, partial [Mycobacterium sp.]|nr:SUKH-4 family immunity protein [Mycobacterium sp.]
MADFVTYGDDPLVREGAGYRAFLRDQGLPGQVITIFRAAPTLRPAPPGVPGVVIGHSREGDDVVADLDSGRVWLCASFRPGAPILINASLPAFVESLVEVAARYPFYPPDRDPEQAEQAADGLRAVLE